MVDHPHHLHTQKSIKIREYAEALEEERRKIQVFQRELPLCLQLVTQAIDSCRQQMQTGVCSDCEETSSEDRGAPVLEEFMPIKRSCEDTRLKQLEEQKDKERLGGKKPDWLRSVQLWNQEENPESNQRLILGENEAKKKGAFHPFCRDKMMLSSTTTAAAAMPTPPSVVTTVAASSSTAETNGGEEKEGGQSQRKTRRCWSPELHRRFLHALQQLGGSHAATPKQIRELMKVDGLTNDEVKSHLQKYRLHTRRPSPAIQSNNNAQPTQFVVVGGIWVPPELAAAAAARSTEATGGGGTTSPTIYAPMAAAPPPRQQNSPTEHSVADDANSSHSPTSSSSHTTSLL